MTQAVISVTHLQHIRERVEALRRRCPSDDCWGLCEYDRWCLLQVVDAQVGELEAMTREIDRLTDWVQELCSRAFPPDTNRGAQQ